MYRFLVIAFCVAWSTPVDIFAAPRPGDDVVVDAKSEEVINGALKYLATVQLPSGAWGASGMEKQYPVAITGYTLMAFLAAGNLPGEGVYGKNVLNGVNYLMNSIGPDGIYGDGHLGQYMYGHGVATIALAEAYGQTKSAALRAKLAKAVKLIISSQNDEGGWRYRPVARDADISVTVLQVVALRAAKNSGIEVPQKTIDDAVKYVKNCYHPSSGGFGYQPGNSPGFARTAAAIYSLQVCGLYDDPTVKAGSKYLFEQQTTDQQWFAYGNFYAAPAQYMMGGETWKKWIEKTKAILLKEVKKEGDTYRWESNSRGGVGVVYSTAVYTMILAMPYQYIPLYQK